MKREGRISNSSLTLLFFIFLVLKLTGVVDWSWWIVTAPIWFIPVFVFTLIVIIFLITILP
jgi:hypothetical protein